jgi:hypothetical protein
MGLFGEIVVSFARSNFGWKPSGSDGYDAFIIAVDAFKRFGTDRQKAVKYLTEAETIHYDYLRRKYPCGYDAYAKAMEEMFERDRLNNEARYKADPLGAWIEDLRMAETCRKGEAEWNRAVDRDRGIYHPDSYYGL